MLIWADVPGGHRCFRGSRCRRFGEVYGEEGATGGPSVFGGIRPHLQFPAFSVCLPSRSYLLAWNEIINIGCWIHVKLTAMEVVEHLSVRDTPRHIPHLTPEANQLDRNGVVVAQNSAYAFILLCILPNARGCIYAYCKVYGYTHAEAYDILRIKTRAKQVSSPSSNTKDGNGVVIPLPIAELR